jgi:hypothetical protein
MSTFAIGDRVEATSDHKGSVVIAVFSTLDGNSRYARRGRVWGTSVCDGRQTNLLPHAALGAAGVLRGAIDGARVSLLAKPYAKQLRREPAIGHAKSWGVTVQILNDQGYSLILRGNPTAARRKFEQAYSLDPGYPVIANNLELLNGSRRFIERPPNNQP